MLLVSSGLLSAQADCGQVSLSSPTALGSNSYSINVLISANTVSCFSDYELVVDLGPNVTGPVTSVAAGVNLTASTVGTVISLTESNATASLPANGTLATITFLLPPGQCVQPLITTATGTNCLNVSCSAFTTPPAAVVCNGSTLSLSGKIRSTGAANPPNSELPGITVKLEITGNPTSYTAVSSYANPGNPYAVTGIPTSESESVAKLYVDQVATGELVDYNCGVDDSDLPLLEKFLDGIPGAELTYFQLVAADIDRDGKVTQTDLTALQHIVDNDEAPPYPYGGPGPADYNKAVVYVTKLDVANHPLGATFSQDASMYGYYFWGYFSSSTNFGNSPTTMLDFAAIKIGDINGDCDLYDPTMLLPQDGQQARGNILPFLGSQSEEFIDPTVYPNPFQDRLTITWEGEERGEGKLELIDARGQVILTKASEVSDRYLTIEDPILSRLPVGTYTLRLVLPSGRVAVATLVKK